MTKTKLDAATERGHDWQFFADSTARCRCCGRSVHSVEVPFGKALKKEHCKGAIDKFPKAKMTPDEDEKPRRPFHLPETLMDGAVTVIKPTDLRNRIGMFMMEKGCVIGSRVECSDVQDWIIEFTAKELVGQGKVRLNWDELLVQAASHLRVALAQAIPSDDQIIIGHIRESALLLDEYLATRKLDSHD